MSDEIKKRINELRALVKAPSAANESEIKEHIKTLFIEIANEIKNLTIAQEELKRIAVDFKNRKSSKTEVEKFYSFVRARTSSELDVSTLLDRGWNLICLEDYDEAVKVLQQALEIDSKNVRALGLMGLTLMNKEKYDQAMLYFQRVITTEPDSPFALNNLGYICFKKGIWGESIEHLTKAAKQKRDKMASLYANYYLGLVYLERNMLDDALNFFEQAVKLGPNLQEAHYHLGLTEIKRYEFKNAVIHFENCLKIDSESKYGKLAKEEIDKIRPLIEPEMIMRRRKKTDGSS